MRELFSKSRGGEVVAQTLSDLGVQLLFSIPGSQVLPIWDVLPRLPHLRLVVPRHERNGVFMAEGYGQAARFPAVVMDTLGPGVANELAGVYSAQKSRTPLLLVSPFQPPWKRPRLGEVFQGLDAPQLFRGIAKKTFVVDHSENLASTLRRACAYSLTKPCGPVRVDIAYPLLFEPVRAEAKEKRKPLLSPSKRKTTRKKLYYVLELREDKKRLEAWLREKHLESTLSRAAVLAPGLSHKGGGLPFALGVKLAAPEAKVILLTEPETILQNLDSFSTAKALSIPLELVTKSSTLRQLESPFELPEARSLQARKPEALLKTYSLLTLIA